jgi:hypothetical protein
MEQLRADRVHSGSIECGMQPSLLGRLIVMLLLRMNVRRMNVSVALAVGAGSEDMTAQINTFVL